MEHRNPLLPAEAQQKFITFGEIMLRLTPPNYEKIRVATNFEASYGGSEANREDSKRFIVLNADIYGAICSLATGGTRK